MIEHMRKVLSDFVPVLNSWVIGDEKRMLDPFETEYSENYAPANAAVLYASVYRSGGEAAVLQQLKEVLKRSVTLLEDREGVAPFCRVFLIHYSLMAVLILPEAGRQAFVKEWKDFYAQYRDDCVQLNTNCAALQWGMELYLEALGCRPANAGYLNELLHFIEDAQNAKGFINDAANHLRKQDDGMPIAYHAFTLFILVSTLAVIEKWSPGMASLQTRAKSVIAKGIDWLMHAVSLDGTFAMIERSSYQMFTWGAFVALICYSGMKPRGEAGLLGKAFEHWLSYKHADGTYSCTPNRLPHQLRTGYESYTHLNMYNNLGLTGIAVAERILERGLTAESDEGDFVVPQNNRFIDRESGYAFVRSGYGFFGCTLRMHHRKYAPAMQGFHFRAAGCKLPIAEPRFDAYQQTDQRFLAAGVWEGYLLKDETPRIYYPDTLENVKPDWIEDGVVMEQETGFLQCTKSIRLLENGIQWDYQLTPKRDFVSCEQVIPIVMLDGAEGTRVLENSPERMEIYYAGGRFELSCSASLKIGISLRRSLLSASGVAAKAHIYIADACKANETIRWSTTMKLQRDGADPL